LASNYVTSGRICKSTVAEFHHQYDGSRIRDYIPVLVEREARDRLAPAPLATVDGDV
jgi:hypothetical protein